MKPQQSCEKPVCSDIRRRMVRLWGAWIMCGLLAGCQTIPDMSTWDQSTRDVTSAVTKAFQTAASVNGDIARHLSNAGPAFQDAAKRYAQVTQTLNDRVNDYEKLFGAIADYSASLAAIARTAETSRQKVESVAGSVNQLVTSLGGTSLAGPAFELIKTASDEGIKFKAAHDFADAVRDADPVVGQVSALLINDLSDLQKTVGATKDEAIYAAIVQPREKALDYRQALARRQSELQAKIVAGLSPKDPNQATRSLLQIEDAAELAKVEQYLRETDNWYGPLMAEIDGALAARAKCEELVIQTGRAVAAWRDSHASLYRAVKERRLPESGRLAALAVQISDLAADLKKEK
jgi:hypothetical protein